MVSFIEYIGVRLSSTGYQCEQKTSNDVFVSTGNDRIWIAYLDSPFTSEQIRRCFDFPGHVLFVVKESLIPQEIVSREETPMWLRVLHGLYMGRIYVWNDRHLFGLHFNYDTGDVSESGIIQPDELLLIETGTWLRGWTGIYKLARFYDRAWWTEAGDSGYQSAGKSQYDQYAQNKWREAAGKSSSRQAYEQERERAQRTQYDSNGFAYDPNDWPNGKPPKPPLKQEKAKRDFMREFAQAGSPSAVKMLYKKLAKENHPDLNPGKDTTEIMTAINLAYEHYR